MEMQYPDPPPRKDLLPNCRVRLVDRQQLLSPGFPRVADLHPTQGTPFLRAVISGRSKAWSRDIFTPCGATLTGSTGSNAPHMFVWPVSQFDILCLILVPSSLHRYWSLINILHPKLHLSIYFQRTQPTSLYHHNFFPGCLAFYYHFIRQGFCKQRLGVANKFCIEL